MIEQTNNHYYGNSIRSLFVITGVLMTISLPYFSDLISMPISVSLIAMLGLAILGGFLNPVQKWIIVVDTLVSILAFAGFEYYAVHTYLTATPNIQSHVYFYWLNQIFALLFFLAVYLSIKTLRGKLLEKSENKNF
ncbi:MAG: hypothetical protein KBC17_03555 [Candidatus Pacebacteria bacterium]|nr:hypothetical protein [Candidatus Paceibacterota bacterium]